MGTRSTYTIADARVPVLGRIPRLVCLVIGLRVLEAQLTHGRLCVWDPEEQVLSIGSNMVSDKRAIPDLHHWLLVGIDSEAVDAADQSSHNWSQR